MLKSKAILRGWAKEIVRCEKALLNANSPETRIKLEEKIETIMILYSSDFEATIFLIEEVEKILLQEGLTN